MLVKAKRRDYSWSCLILIFPMQMTKTRVSWGCRCRFSTQACLFSYIHNHNREEENNLAKIQSRTTTVHPTPTARSGYRGILTNSILCFWLILIGAVSRQMKTLSPASSRAGHQRRRPCFGGGHRCRDHNKRAGRYMLIGTDPPSWQKLHFHLLIYMQ